ncbi:hypothetical protein DUNSADRAFT_4155 [Dunaliella salina]|uniref:Uncharacterized protein n=1 Tax=Dunaliella salina TaxID=3046 RepID=A0ABQ7GSK0_DUNSA|nr:hypothetical protein DUNSADRAFT_4155 [Dunaliella salina]|eukprot:KAF5837584.1 hypothetical protein DUNSADRAFT_4155 [Dunaliella salina]
MNAHKKFVTQLGNPCQASYSVKECKDNKCATLNLSSCEIRTVPEELRAKSLEAHLHALNLSSNPLGQLEPCDHFLPTSLRELHLSGCSLRSLPNSLTRLARLQRFFAGANLLSNVDVLFRLPSLQHAGLSFNRIETLPQALLPTCTSLLSLDISHNSMTSLDQTFASLQALPNLQVLGLQGNPICLLPNYSTKLQEEVAPKLVYLNGQKLDAVSANRPQGASQLPRTQSSIRARQTVAVPPNAAQGSGGDALQLGASGGDTNLRIELKNLTLGGVPDPYASLHKLWAEEQAAAQATGQPATFTLLPPPQPVVYYFELSTFEEDGGSARSNSAMDRACQHQSPQLAGHKEGHTGVPLDKDISTPHAPDQRVRDEHGDRKQPSPPRSPLSNGHAEEVDNNQAGGDLQLSDEQSVLAQVQAHPQNQAGGAQEGCELPSPPKSDLGGVSEAGSGSIGSSTTTTLASIPLVLQPPEAPTPEQDAPKGKGAAAKSKPMPQKPPIKAGKGGKGEAPDELPKLERGSLQAVLPLKASVACRNWLRNVDMSKYNIVPHTELLGLGTVRAGSSYLLKGSETANEMVAFIPEPALWDAQGMRMALEDPRHSTEAIAELEASLTLHAPLPPMPSMKTVATPPPEKSGRKSPLANSPARPK